MTNNLPLDDLLKKSLAYTQWQRIGIWPHHGLNLPLFSLRSAHSCGIGEFPDLLPLIPWCREIGLDILQLLPLNDTGLDPSPYNAISAFALNPIHLGLMQLEKIAEYPHLMDQINALQQLNTHSRIAYAEVHEGKNRILRDYLALEGEQIVKSPLYEEFRHHHAWVKGYALFKALKNAHGWSTSWEKWPSLVSSDIAHLEEQFANEMQFHSLVQFLCFQQFEGVKKHALDQKVLIKGDIPILISRESADVWLNPLLFDLKDAAGAPPDMYNKDGQHWGFPLYNWSEIERTGYEWWKQRVKVAETFYDLYRLDHVVGFFRIWAIPEGKSAKEGHFIPEDSSTWISHGRKILEVLLGSSTMLPIGEDLGVIPPAVRVCLAELGICGTKVMRWERMWEEDKRFIKPEDYSPLSMTTVSTHDSDTLPLWWMHEPQEAMEYSAYKGWPYDKTLSKEHLKELLRESHQTASLFHINLLQEYLALVPGLTWPNPEDERINVPGTVSDNNWSYRFRPSVEEIIANANLKQILTDIIDK